MAKVLNAAKWARLDCARLLDAKAPAEGYPTEAGNCRRGTMQRNVSLVA